MANGWKWKMAGVKWLEPWQLHGGTYWSRKASLNGRTVTRFLTVGSKNGARWSV